MYERRLRKKTMKCDLTNKLDHSEDGDVNIKGIDNCKMSEPEERV